LIPEAEAEHHLALTEAYKRAFRAARQSGELQQPLFTGIAALLDDLRTQGWLLGVATGMSRRGLDHCLATHHLSDHFITLQTADDHPSKPHPAMLEAALLDAAADQQDAVMIGDTVFDMQMACDAGVRAIGVDWGYHPPHELLAAGATGVATSPTELGEILRR
jgi:phosphoglycolate phosphatase